MKGAKGAVGDRLRILEGHFLGKECEIFRLTEVGATVKLVISTGLEVERWYPWKHLGRI